RIPASTRARGSSYQDDVRRDPGCEPRRDSGRDPGDNPGQYPGRDLWPGRPPEGCYREVVGTLSTWSDVARDQADACPASTSPAEPQGAESARESYVAPRWMQSLLHPRCNKLCGIL